jgi:hypothetical protein
VLGVLRILPIEAIVRGYITGSAWNEYKKSGTVHGIKVLQDWAEGFRDLGREVEGDEVGAEGGVCFLQGLEPRH